MGFVKGNEVCSVGGEFIRGIVEDVEYNNNLDILTVRWIEHRTKGKINFVQKRSTSIVRHI